jgi:PKD repeat protein
LQTPPPVFFNEAGTYEVSLTVTNANGSSTETKTDYIVTGYAPEANFQWTVTYDYDETTIDFEDFSLNDPTFWEWTFEGGTPGSSILQNPTGIIYTEPGLFNLSLTASNNFGSDNFTWQFYVDVISGITENIGEGFKVFPNPSSGILNIELNDVIVENIGIYNSLGKIIYQVNSIQKEEMIIDLSKFDNGIYYLKFETSANSTIKKIILTD